MFQIIPDGFAYNPDGSIKYRGEFSTQTIDGGAVFLGIYKIADVCKIYLKILKIQVA